MLLSARVLQNCVSVNIFQYADQFSFTKGDTVTLYFVLTDASVDRASQGFVPAGRRYIPAVGATLSVKINNISDPSKNISRMATNPFLSPSQQDTSIWSLPILSTDDICGLVSMQLTLTEGSVVTNGYVQGAFMVFDPNVSVCDCTSTPCDCSGH